MNPAAIVLFSAAALAASTAQPPRPATGGMQPRPSGSASAEFLGTFANEEGDTLTVEPARVVLVFAHDSIGRQYCEQRIRVTARHSTRNMICHTDRKDPNYTTGDAFNDKMMFTPAPASFSPVWEYRAGIWKVISPLCRTCDEYPMRLRRISAQVATVAQAAPPRRQPGELPFRVGNFLVSERPYSSSTPNAVTTVAYAKSMSGRGRLAWYCAAGQAHIMYTWPERTRSSEVRFSWFANNKGWVPTTEPVLDGNNLVFPIAARLAFTPQALRTDTVMVRAVDPASKAPNVETFSVVGLRPALAALQCMKGSV